MNSVLRPHFLIMKKNPLDWSFGAHPYSIVDRDAVIFWNYQSDIITKPISIYTRRWAEFSNRLDRNPDQVIEFIEDNQYEIQNKALWQACSNEQDQLRSFSSMPLWALEELWNKPLPMSNTIIDCNGPWTTMRLKHQFNDDKNNWKYDFRFKYQWTHRRMRLDVLNTWFVSRCKDPIVMFGTDALFQNPKDLKDFSKLFLN